MTKKHFIEIAGILSNHISESKEGFKGQYLNFPDGESLLKDIADYFKSQNPLFNKERFKKACLE